MGRMERTPRRAGNQHDNLRVAGQDRTHVAIVTCGDRNIVETENIHRSPAGVVRIAPASPVARECCCGPSRRGALAPFPGNVGGLHGAAIGGEVGEPPIAIRGIWPDLERERDDPDEEGADCGQRIRFEIHSSSAPSPTAARLARNGSTGNKNRHSNAMMGFGRQKEERGPTPRPAREWRFAEPSLPRQQSTARKALKSENFA